MVLGWGGGGEGGGGAWSYSSDTLQVPGAK